MTMGQSNTPGQFVQSNPFILLGNPITELRIFPREGVGGPWSGYFDDPAKFIEEATRWDGRGDIYFTLNEINPDLIYRKNCNKVMRAGKGETTSDAQVVRRTWFFIDFDPKRVKDISATDAEKARAWALLREVGGFLREGGFSEPVVADSGNGYHLLYRIDLPNDADSKSLVERLLKGLSDHFSNDAVEIDRAVFNASRITKCYGAMTLKGADNPQRPHRRSGILRVPERIEAADRSILEAMADRLAPGGPAKSFEALPPRQGFDLERWISEHGVRIKNVEDTSDGRRYYLEDGCPFNPEHAGKDAVLFQYASGAVGFKCFHNSCADKTWRDFRELYEPDAYRRRLTARDDRSSEAHGLFIDPVGAQEARQRYTLDDLGAARLYADTMRGRGLYLPEYKSYWVYSGGAWMQDKGDLRAEHLAKELAEYVCGLIPPEASNQEEDKWAYHRKHYNKYRAYKFRRTQLQDARSELAGYAAQFDRQPYLFNCRNGTLDLEAMTLRPHRPEDMLSKKANVLFDPAARCERFERFIDEITEGVPMRADMLQKALGYALQGEADQECYFTVIGQKTRNGKGTLFDTVMNIFGTYGAQIDFNTLARSGAKDGSRATPDLARLIGVRFALANEPEKGVCVNEALLKQLTGNDDITARPLYGDTIQFKPVFKLFVTANSKPAVSDDSLFASGRIKLLPFTRYFGEEERDTGLKALFRTEKAKSGIFNWLLAGYKKFKSEGLRDTEEMKRLTDEYRRENDYIGQFLDERVTLGDGKRTTLKAVRLDYARWCETIGTKPLGLKMFKEELEKHDVTIRIIRGIQYYIDGSIRADYDYAGEQVFS